MITDLNVIIELGGEQHFMQTSSLPSSDTQHDNPEGLVTNKESTIEMPRINAHQHKSS